MTGNDNVTVDNHEQVLRGGHLSMPCITICDHDNFRESWCAKLVHSVQQKRYLYRGEPWSRYSKLNVFPMFFVFCGVLHFVRCYLTYLLMFLFPGEICYIDGLPVRVWLQSSSQVI